LQFDVQFRHARLRGVDFVLGEFLHVRIGQHLLRGGDVALRRLVLAIDGHERTQFGVFAVQLAEAVHVRGGAFGHQEFVQFDEAVGQLVQLGQHGWFHHVLIGMTADKPQEAARGCNEG
jgi:hypothetical protein